MAGVEGRVATPQEVAELIAFLVSEEASGISGEAISIVTRFSSVGA